MKTRFFLAFGMICYLLATFFTSQLQADYLFIGLPKTSREAFWLALPEWGLWVVFYPLIVWLVAKIPVDGNYSRGNLAIQISASLLITISKLSLEEIWLSFDASIHHIRLFRDYHNYLIYWSIVGIAFATRYYTQFREKDRQTVQLQAELKQAQQHAMYNLQLLQAAQHNPSTPKQLVIKNTERVIFIDFTDILWIEAAGNYAHVHTVNGAIHTMRNTMKSLEKSLDNPPFLRIHRSLIVNSKAIASLKTITSGEIVVQLSNGFELYASRRYRNNLSHLLN